MKSIVVAAALALVTPTAGFAQAAPTSPADPTSVPMPAANWLFAQTATSMTFGQNTLTLKGVAPQTLMFTDRPERMTGDAPVAKFVDYWTSGKSDFEKDPPNATLSVVVGGKNQLSVVELTNPVLMGDTLTYTVKVLDGTPPAAGQATSLFIDWWYGPGWHHGPYWRGGGPWGPFAGGNCWRGPYGALHCRPAWGY